VARATGGGFPERGCYLVSTFHEKGKEKKGRREKREIQEGGKE